MVEKITKQTASSSLTEAADTLTPENWIRRLGDNRLKYCLFTEDRG